MEFYSVQLRKKVDVDDKQLTKVQYRRTTSGGKEQIRYAVKAEHTEDGKKIPLTKFVNKETYDSLQVPERIDSGDKTDGGNGSGGGGAQAEAAGTKSSGRGSRSKASSGEGGGQEEGAKTTRSRAKK